MICLQTEQTWHASDVSFLGWSCANMFHNDWNVRQAIPSNDKEAAQEGVVGSNASIASKAASPLSSWASCFFTSAFLLESKKKKKTLPFNHPSHPGLLESSRFLTFIYPYLSLGIWGTSTRWCEEHHGRNESGEGGFWPEWAHQTGGSWNQRWLHCDWADFPGEGPGQPRRLQAVPLAAGTLQMLLHPVRLPLRNQRVQ